MTDHANPWLLAFLIGGCAVFLLAIVAPLWRLRRRKNGHEPTELDLTQMDDDYLPVPPQVYHRNNRDQH